MKVLQIHLPTTINDLYADSTSSKIHKSTHFMHNHNSERFVWWSLATKRHTNRRWTCKGGEKAYIQWAVILCPHKGNLGWTTTHFRHTFFPPENKFLQCSFNVGVYPYTLIINLHDWPLSSEAKKKGGDRPPPPPWRRACAQLNNLSAHALNVEFPGQASCDKFPPYVPVQWIK